MLYDAVVGVLVWGELEEEGEEKREKDGYSPMMVVAAPAAAPATSHLLMVGCSK